MHPTPTLRRTVLVLALGTLCAAPALAQSASGQQDTTTGSRGSDTGSMQSDSKDWKQAATPPETGTRGRAADEHERMGGDDGFTRMDSDHDGRISAAEAGTDPDFSSRFGSLDSDGDGYVSRAEYDAGNAMQTPPPRP